MKFEHINGFCPMCGDQMFRICDACHRPGEALPNQRQFLVTFENGDQTWLGVCEKHIDELSVAAANGIHQGIADAGGFPAKKIIAINVDSIHAGRPKEPKFTHGNQMYESNNEGAE